MKRRLLCLAFVFLCIFAHADEEAKLEAPQTNKLQYMYSFYYLPFSLDFREGDATNDVLPYIRLATDETPRMLKPDELKGLDKEWNAIKDSWKKKSLLLSTSVGINEKNAISQRLISHHIGLSRTPFDTLSLTERVQVTDALKAKTPEVQSAFKQLRFLKSFLSPLQEEKFNFFIFSPSWCESSKEYRVLFEQYAKTFSNPSLVLHSVVIEDPKEEIFDSRIMKELFPNPARYSHENVPRFLAVQTIQGGTNVWEEGEALKELYQRFYADHRGFLDDKTTIFGKPKPPTRQIATPRRNKKNN